MKMKSAPITKEDIEEFLDDESDFAFELKVLNVLTSLEFKCEHGGTYYDPIYNKAREFDIRARYSRRRPQNVFLGVECKNLRDNFPLLVYTRPRRREESYQYLIKSFDPVRVDSQNVQSDQMGKLLDQSSLYHMNDFVGKAVDQVGKKSGGPFTTGDDRAFQKIYQAVSSAYDLLNEARGLYSQGYGNQATTVIPVLVVPNDRLWEVRFDVDGNIVRDPTQVGHVSYYLGQSFEICKLRGAEFTISHLEIVTDSSLETFINNNLIPSLSYWHEAASAER